MGTVNGQQILMNGPYFYHNPPICVPDGTYRQELSRSGETIDIQNCAEDLDAAIVEIVTQTVRSQV